jgi:hypothetical protein
MRAYTIVTIICLATSVAPSSATALKQYAFLFCCVSMLTVPDRTKRKLNYKQVATYGLVAAVINAAISTTIATNYAWVVNETNKHA